MPLPNSLPWMESVDAKMIRAHEHIEALGRASIEYLASIKINLNIMTAAQLPNPWLVAVASDYIPPIALSAMLGDCVHNMRAALDNLVCGLARTQDRFCTCKDTAFPYTQKKPIGTPAFKPPWRVFRSLRRTSSSQPSLGTIRPRRTHL